MIVINDIAMIFPRGSTPVADEGITEEGGCDEWAISGYQRGGGFFPLCFTGQLTIDPSSMVIL